MLFFRKRNDTFVGTNPPDRPAPHPALSIGPNIHPNEKNQRFSAAVAPASEHACTAEIPAARRIVDAANDTPVGFATTALLRDSTAVSAVAADAQGRFELSADAAGEYRLQVSMVATTPKRARRTQRCDDRRSTIRLRRIRHRS